MERFGWRLGVENFVRTFEYFEVSNEKFSKRLLCSISVRVKEQENFVSKSLDSVHLSLFRLVVRCSSVPVAAPKKVTFVSTLDFFFVTSVVYTSLFRLVVFVVDSM